MPFKGPNFPFGKRYKENIKTREVWIWLKPTCLMKPIDDWGEEKLFEVRWHASKDLLSEIIKPFSHRQNLSVRFSREISIAFLREESSIVSTETYCLVEVELYSQFCLQKSQRFCSQQSVRSPPSQLLFEVPRIACPTNVAWRPKPTAVKGSISALVW